MIGRLLHWRARRRIRAVARAGMDPGAAQRDALERILRAGSATPFGRERDLAAVRSPEDFRARVPLREGPLPAPSLDRVALAAFVAAAGDRHPGRGRAALASPGPPAPPRRDVRVLVGAPSWALLLMDAVERRSGRPLRDLWPRFRGLLHAGVRFEPYREVLRRRAGLGISFVEAILAGDAGAVAVQTRSDDGGLLVVPDGRAYVELVPAEELRADAPRRLGLEQAEKGQDYALAITGGGLWALVPGEIVRFRSLAPPRIAVVGNTRLNAFGERVREEELAFAVAEAASKAGSDVREYAILPEFPTPTDPRGRHVWHVEFDRPPPDLDAFAAAIDDALQRTHDLYRLHRESGQLRPPSLRLLPAGAFARAGAVRRVIDASAARTLAAPS